MKTWKDLKKGDKLWLMVPFVDDEGVINYEIQESSVISNHPYTWCTNIRLKYTDLGMNKRRRINLCIPEKISEIPCASPDERISYGSIVVTYGRPEYLGMVFDKLVENKIKELTNLINSQEKYKIKLESFLRSKKINGKNL